MGDVRNAAGNRTDRPVAGPDRYSALAVVLPHVLETLRREPALTLTIAYLMVSLAGIYFDYGFYQEGFGIPILSLAQIGDYLVAGLQQPVAIALVAATFPLCWIMDLVSTRFHRRDAARRERLQALPRLGGWQKLHLRYLDWYLGNLWLTHVGYLLAIVIYGWVFVGLYAKYRVAEIRRGGAPPVVVHLTGTAAGFTAGGSASWGYLGAVTSYVFLYDHVRRQALVVPVNAVAGLRPAPVAGAGASPEPVAPKP